MNHIFKSILYCFFILSLISCDEKNNDVDLGDPNTEFPAPSGLVIEKISASEAKISWKDNSNGEEGFYIERTDKSTNSNTKNTVGANVTEFIDNKLEETVYEYKVCAYYKQRTSDYISFTYKHTPIGIPQNFKVEVNNDGKIALSWDAFTEKIDGFKVERKSATGAYSLWKQLDANTTTVIDENPFVGANTYKLYAYSGEYTSTEIERTIISVGEPEITINNLQISYLKISPMYTLKNDGGETCTVGVCWSTQPNPTIENSQIVWGQKAAKDANCFANIDKLNENTTYYFRAFATNSKHTSYSNELAGKIDTSPKPINLTWTEMTTVNSSLAAEVKLYETSSNLNGRKFKAYYAIADLSTGSVELKAFHSTTAKKPSKYVTDATDETVYVMTNAGYFGYSGTSASSYSLLIDRGAKKAENISTLTRGSYAYPVTRGAFGVTQNQTPVMQWVSGNYGYDVPNPNVEGEVPQKSPSSTHPMQAQTYNAYSAVGGAPILMKDGRIVFDFTTTKAGKYLTNYELLQTDIFTATVRPPRTLIGSTADNKVVLFVCDGRQAHSDGATLLELAQIMKAIGCVNVLNLDGGGSSAIIANNILLNKPSDGAERAVPTTIAFVKRK